MHYCDRYRPLFNVARQNVCNQARCYAAGLLVVARRKNMERMEEYVPDYNYQSQQQFLSDSPWKDEKVREQIAQDVNKVVGGQKSALIIDESSFEKKGVKSVGVSRQWNGRLGKVENSQVGVFSALCNGTHDGLVGLRLYLPKCWTDDKARCKAAKVPVEHQKFKTKSEQALELIDLSRKQGLSYGWVGMDAGYGKSPWLLRAIDDRNIEFVVDVHCDQVVYEAAPAPYLPVKEKIQGRKFSKLRTDQKGCTVKAYFDKLPKKDWEKVRSKQGTKGDIWVYAARKRVWFWDEKEAVARYWWVVCIKGTDTDELKWFISNAPKQETLKSLVRKQGVRYWIERIFQDAKTSVGMADYQVRGWTAWHHHMTMVMLALLFMLEERVIHSRDIELLSCNDIVEVLNYYLPRADATEDAVFADLQRRHRKRKQAIEAARRKSQDPKKAASSILTK